MTACFKFEGGSKCDQWGCAQLCSNDTTTVTVLQWRATAHEKDSGRRMAQLKGANLRS